MGFSEFMFVLLIAGVLLGAPVAALILSLIAYSRSKKIDVLTQKMIQLEAQFRILRSHQLSETAAPASALTHNVMSQTSDVVPSEKPQESASGTSQPIETQAIAPPVLRTEQPPVTSTAAGLRPSAEIPSYKESRPATETDPVGWESFIGQKAFGWLAVVLFVLSAAFFLNYAFQNNWVGPIGRVAVGEIVGALLIWGGWRYFRSGMIRFSRMLTSAGIIVLYLATYSAFGIYQLLPQTHVGFFLAILIIESMVVAVLYRSATIALVAVIGGLLTPVLLGSDHDSYKSFFCYLAMLNAGVLAALTVRSWAFVGSTAFTGTQLLFWLWYAGNYHPEKFAWAMGFQTVLFVMYVSRNIHVTIRRTFAIVWEELALTVAVPLTFFLGFRVLAQNDYAQWLGTAAVCMSAVYASMARIVLKRSGSDQRMQLTFLSIALAFAAWAVPLQADARWVSLGWAAMAAALWWFGLRISTLPLRAMAGLLGAAAVTRVLMLDLPLFAREPFIPILNRYALPSIGVAACLLRSVVVADPWLKRLQETERVLIGVFGVAGIMLLWLILSIDCYGYFVSQAVYDNDVLLWSWRGQLALTVLWTAFATGLLILGFSWQRARMRWLAMILFGITVSKLFVVDMANVQQLYRIMAFFVLAVVLGLVARAYQKFR